MDRPRSRRLAVLTSHPIQYYGPLFRVLAQQTDLHVFFAHKATPEEQARAGFGVSFDWDIDPTAGYAHSFLRNVARAPGTDHFAGCDTPDIGAHLNDGGFDALLVTGWHLKCFVQGALAVKRLGIPVLIRGDSQLVTPRSRLKRVGKMLLYPLLLRLFDAALPVGERSRAYYTHYGYPQDRLFSSPHCIDTDWFAARATPDARARLRAELGIGADTDLLLFAGKLVPFKRPADLIAATAECRRRERKAEVMIAGDGELRPHLTALAKELEVPLHCLGFRNQTEMAPAYAAADCLVLPSSGAETWGLVANEALACGCPIIVSDACGCMPDLTRDNLAGCSFPMGDVPALSQAIMTVLSAPPAPEAIRDVSNAHRLEVAAAGILKALRYLRSKGLEVETCA